MAACYASPPCAKKSSACTQLPAMPSAAADRARGSSAKRDADAAEAAAQDEERPVRIAMAAAAKSLQHEQCTGLVNLGNTVRCPLYSHVCPLTFK